MTGAHGRASYLAAGADGKLYRYSPKGKEAIDRVARLNATPPPTESYEYKHIFGEAQPSDMPCPTALTDLGAAMRPRPTASQTYDCSADDDDGGIPSGYTYLGQFIVHDMTYLDPATGKDLRSPALDLDSVLPMDDPSNFISKLSTLGPAAIGRTQDQPEIPEDLPRHIGGPSGKPIIADDRNDNFLPLSQCHVLLLKFYNAIAKELCISWTPVLRPEDHRRVREIWVRHFQYAVLHDYLPRIVGCDTYNDVLHGKRAIVHPQRFCEGVEVAWMPLEFAAALGRFGHSMIRHCYAPWNQKLGRTPVTLSDFIDQSYRNSGDCLSEAGRRIPARWINDWFNLLDFSDTAYGPSHPIMANRIDTNLAAPLGVLPNKLLDDPLRPDPPCPLLPSGDFNLAAQTLMRVSWCHLMPAQDALSILNTNLANLVPPQPPIVLLKPDEICDARKPEEAKAFANHPELRTKTPLWFYMLREAEKRAGGRHLGPFGGRIVMETIHAAIEASSVSILDGNSWVPTLGPRARSGQFTFADLVAFAGDPNPLGTS
jgi:hypothetical protein